MTDGRWQCANRLRRAVSHSIDVAECISRNIVESVIGPQSAGDGSFAKGKASPKGEASTNRLAEAAVADRQVTRKAATDKMGAAPPGAMIESHGVGRHRCRDEYSGRSGYKVPPQHQYSSRGAPDVICDLPTLPCERRSNNTGGSASIPPSMLSAAGHRLVFQ